MNTIEIMKNITSIEVFNTPLSKWILAIIIYLLITFLLKRTVRFIISHIDKAIKDRSKNFRILLLQQIEEIPKYFYITVELYIPLQLITMPDIFSKIITGIFAVVLLIQIVKILQELLTYSLKWAFTKKWKLEETTLNALRLFIKIILRSIGLILLLSNLGIEISPLLASLGIWGIAVAFALQNILQDLFSSFSIISSRPFKVGDYIKLWDIAGTVKEISLKATHILSIKGYEIRIPNKEILNGVLENYRKMNYRRVRFEIGVVYDTNPSQLKKIPKMIQKIIEQEDNITFERAKLTELASYSIQFKISYIIHDKSYTTYLDKNSSILIAILEKFEKEKIEIAFPTQVIHTIKQ